MKTITQLFGLRSQTHFIRFLIVGFSGLLVNTALLALAVEGFGVHYLVGAFFATQGSTLWNFIWSEVWVFGSRDKQQSALKRLGSFYLMNNILLLFRAPLLTLFTSIVGLNYLVGNLLSIFILTIGRFLISDRWIWKNKPERIMNQYYFYNIHNLITLASTTRLPELEYFLSETSPDHLDLVFTTVEKKTIDKIQSSINYDEGFGNFGFWLYIQRGEQTNVYVSPALKYSPHVLYTNVVEPILRWEFVRKGYALIHGACLSYQGMGLMITAATDTGKTTTILKCLENYPFEFISDDMVILSADGQMLTYPKPMTISLHTLRAVDTNNLTIIERLKLQFQSRLHSRLGRKIGLLFGNINLPAATLNMYVQMLIPPPKYHVDRLIPHVKHASHTRLGYIVVIHRGKSTIEKILPQEVIPRIVAKNIEDAYGFPPYPQLATQLCKWGEQDLHIEENRLIKKVMEHLPAIVLSRPDYDWWKRIPIVFTDEQGNLESSITMNKPRMNFEDLPKPVHIK